MTEQAKDPLDVLCEHFNINASEVARSCNMTRQAVNCWRKNGIPVRWAYQFIQRSNGALTMAVLRPQDTLGCW